MAAVSRLALTNFRSYASALVEPQANFILLFGENGAGKTNVLEAVSMLAPGRGLRGAPLLEMARRSGDRSWAVAARLEDTEIGTGTLISAPERRQVRIKRAGIGQQLVRMVVRLVGHARDGPIICGNGRGAQTYFFDRLVLALEPSHAHHATRYDAAMRARNKLLTGEVWDEVWLSSLESAMEEHGRALFEARVRTIDALDARIDAQPQDEFARAKITLDGWNEGDLALELSANRKRNSAAGRTIEGPHRQDLIVVHRSKQIPAASSSTGEQKALLLGIILAHRDLVAELRGKPPVLLLDEVAAHLDPKRRDALFARLEPCGQVWMTATEAALFEGIANASRFRVEPGLIERA